jgi:hypothetical protein
MLLLLLLLLLTLTGTVSILHSSDHSPHAWHCSLIQAACVLKLCQHLVTGHLQ